MTALQPHSPAPAGPEAPAARGRRDSASGLESRPEFYLLYLGFYFTPWFFDAPGRADLIAGIGAALAFAPVYVLCLGGGQARALAGAAFSVALALGLIGFEGMSGTYAIYAVTLAAGVKPPRLALIVMLAAGGIWIAGALALGVSLFELAITSFMSVMAGAATLSGFTATDRAALKERALRLDAELAAVRERERIARDLHDVLGHTLTTIAVKSDLARRLMASDPEGARREVTEIRDAARASLKEVRAAVAGMHRTTLAAEIDRMQASLTAAAIALERTGSCPALWPEAETALGMAVREAATNIVRHSGARSASLAISVSPGRLEIRVEDDGGGNAPVEGEGLTGLRRRLESVGGALKTGRGERGVRLVMTAPLTPQREALS